MKDSTVFESGMGELGLGIEGVLRRAARSLIEQAIETEVSVLLEEFSAVRMVNGRQAVVRNGHLPEREIMTALGPVPVKVPKVRDRSGSGIKFNSALVPPYVRKSRTVAATVPWLYLHGVSSGHMQEALSILLGEEAKGLSPAALGRLKAQWTEEHAAWQCRSLEGKRYAYWWVDGVYTNLRAEEDPRICLLVIIGVTADGNKELVSVSDGLRESKASWLEILRDLQARGLEAAPLLAIGDGAMGFWAALDEAYPETRQQRCWVHKTANILNELPKSKQGKAKAALQESGWPRAGRLRRKLWRPLCATTRRSIPRPWPSWKRIERSYWLSMIIRPNIGDTSAPPIPLNRPLPPCVTGHRALKTACRATASLDWASKCCSRPKSAGSPFSIRRKCVISLRE